MPRAGESSAPVERNASGGPMELVFKICGEEEWRLAEKENVYRGSTVDLRDGFIHFSTAEQLAETAAKHFAGRGDLLLIAVSAEALGQALRFEPSRGGALFPHLYGPLPLGRCVSSKLCRSARMASISWRRPSDCVPAMMSLAFRLAKPFLSALDAEHAHRLAIAALRLAPQGARAIRRRAARDAGLRPHLRQSRGACGRLRQGWRGHRRMSAARLRLRRDRRRDAAAATGKSAAATVSGCRPTRP